MDGVIYYKAQRGNSHQLCYVLVCFDVRSEKFSHMQAPKPLIDNKDSSLINYKGKLGHICCRNGVEIWVMEDGEKKQEWPKIFSYMMEGFEKCYSSTVVTPGGEIVFVDRFFRVNDPFRVMYYDPK